MVSMKQSETKQSEQEVVANCSNIDEKMSSNGNRSNLYLHNKDIVINLDHGDPKMYYSYWKKVDDECAVTIKASELITYFADLNDDGCPYQMPKFTDAVRRLHRVVGNAVVDGRYIIGGTGSSHLFINALRALASTLINPATSTSSNQNHIPVVCAEPYYSVYEEAVKEEKSESFKWRGDANTFDDEEGPYIEVVTSPNNPDGCYREPVVKKRSADQGKVISDLAYYWPQYTPITAPADYDIMLFTLSKVSGHAGSRVGWAIVKDKEIAIKMMKQIWLTSIGICHEGQLRATKILEFIANTNENYYYKHPNPVMTSSQHEEGLFEFGHRILGERWNKLRAVVKHSGAFSLPDFSPGLCNFMGKLTYPNPAFAWMECKRGEDGAKLMSEVKIRARSGSRFGLGVSPKYVRINMLGTDDSFNLFLQRLSSLN